MCDAGEGRGAAALASSLRHLKLRLLSVKTLGG